MCELTGTNWSRRSRPWPAHTGSGCSPRWRPGRTYVSQLARDLGISRALLQVHLKKLEKAGLVTAHLEVSDDGKAMKFYEVVPFSLHLTPTVSGGGQRHPERCEGIRAMNELTFCRPPAGRSPRRSSRRSG